MLISLSKMLKSETAFSLIETLTPEHHYRLFVLTIIIRRYKFRTREGVFYFIVCLSYLINIPLITSIQVTKRILPKGFLSQKFPFLSKILHVASNIFREKKCRVRSIFLDVFARTFLAQDKATPKPLCMHKKYSRTIPEYVYWKQPRKF